MVVGGGVLEDNPAATPPRRVVRTLAAVAVRENHEEGMTKEQGFGAALPV